MLSKKTNPTPTVTTAKVTAPDMLRAVLVAGKATRTAALQLCYTSAAYILIVNHFTDSKAKGYMTRPDAVDYLCKQISDQAGVKGNMLDLYIRNASKLVGILVGSIKMFSPTIQRLGNATTPDEMVGILSDWMEGNHERKIESMSQLSEALGYKTSRPTRPQTDSEKAAKAPERIANVIKGVEKLAAAVGGTKLKESSVAQAVVSNVKSPVTFAREAIKRITELDDLHALELAIKAQITFLKRLSQQAKSAAGEREEQYKATVKRHKASPPKAKPVQQTV